MAAREPQVGDLADHKSGRLDPRRIVRVEKKGRGFQIWLRFASDKPFGPYPASNYVITKGR